MQAPKTDILKSSVMDTLVDVIEQDCRCNFNAGNIITESFNCYPDGYRHAVYRAEIAINATNSDHSMARVLNDLEMWINSGGSVEAGGRRYDISTRCDVRVESLNEDLCHLDRPTLFTITDNMLYSFLIGIGLAIIALSILIIAVCCLIR